MQTTSGRPVLTGKGALESLCAIDTTVIVIVIVIVIVMEMEMEMEMEMPLVLLKQALSGKMSLP